MKRYIIKRLFLIIPILFGITLITFSIIHLTPGGFTTVNMQMDIRTSPDSIARLKSLYGLDKPIHIRYLDWLKRFIFFDFGNSFLDGRPVIDKVLERLPATLLLNISALVLVFLFGIIIGVTCAVRRNSFYDVGMTFFTFLGYSIPAFWLALILMLIFGVKLNLLPISGIKSVNFDFLSTSEKNFRYFKAYDFTCFYFCIFRTGIYITICEKQYDRNIKSAIHKSSVCKRVTAK